MTDAGTFIPRVFEEHFETVGLLWSRRRVALRSPEYVAADIVDLDETIEAHFEGLAAAGEDSISILEAELLGDEALRAFAAAYALVLAGSPDALTRVFDAFTAAKGPRLDALRDALAHGPSTPLVPQLTSLFLSAAPDVGAAAAEALAFRGAITPVAEQLERFIRAEEPFARASGWRTTAYCGVAVPDSWYEAGLRDDDANVKRAAFDAATWNRSATFYSYARGVAAELSPEAIEPLATLAAVAPPEEYRLIGTVAANPAAGPDRFRVIGSFGHPYFVDFLLKEIENPDPAVAASAGAAFEKITGWNAQSLLRKKPPADGEPETPESAFVPDPTSARKHWAEVAPRLAHSPRIARGFDVSQGVSREIFDALDMESRWEYCLRMRLFSGWQGTPLVLERYPQRF
jgi:uncharacterized protein (TIGR02270 family)